MKRFIKLVTTEEFDGAAFRRARIAAGISLTEIANRLKVRPCYIHRLEELNEGAKGSRIEQLVKALDDAIAEKGRTNG